MNFIERSDSELIAAVVLRDPTALEALYDRYAPNAFGLAIKILADRSLAEDILQEAFLRVWKSASSFDASRGSFPTWFLGIVHHLAIDELRRRGGRSFDLVENRESDVSLEVLDSAPDVIETVSTRWEHERIRNALSQLAEEQRQVIVMAYFQGLTRQEIATRLGAPLGTIHTRARLGLQKLKAILASQELKD